MADMTELPVARAQALARAERAVEAAMEVAVTHRAERGYGQTNFSWWSGYDEAMKRVEFAIRDALGETT